MIDMLLRSSLPRFVVERTPPFTLEVSLRAYRGGGVFYCEEYRNWYALRIRPMLRYGDDIHLDAHLVFFEC